MPLFFVLTGLRVDVTVFTDPHVWLLTAAIAASAVAGKLVAGLGAGEGQRRLVVGLGMVPRGEVTLIFATTGAAIQTGAGPLLPRATLSAILAAVVTVAVLSRGKRKISDWLRDLRGAAAPGRGNYRESAPTSDPLWRVLEDPNADGSARAAAAVALGSTTETSQRTRIAAIASTVASPRLRVALETIVSGSDRDEVLAEMLEDVEIESARAAR